MPRRRSAAASAVGAVASAAEAPAEDAGSLRARVLAFIQGEAGPTGEIVLPSRRIAEALGANVASVNYHLQRLARLGEISTSGAGPKGTRIRLGGRPAAQGAGRRRGTATAAAARAKAALNFCPYCGRKVPDHSWRYCGSCGKELR